MLESLKAYILNWLGLTDVASKSDIEIGFQNALICTGELIDKRVPRLVADELDKDERTLVLKPDITLTVDEARIKEAIDRQVQQAIAEASRK